LTVISLSLLPLTVLLYL